MQSISRNIGRRIELAVLHGRLHWLPKGRHRLIPRRAYKEAVMGIADIDKILTTLGSSANRYTTWYPHWYKEGKYSCRSIPHHTYYGSHIGITIKCRFPSRTILYFSYHRSHKSFTKLRVYGLPSNLVEILQGLSEGMDAKVKKAEKKRRDYIEGLSAKFK